MNRFIVLLVLSFIASTFGITQTLSGVLWDQAPSTMTACGSAGTANGGAGFTGTDFQLPLGSYTDNEKGLVGKECNAVNGWSTSQCGTIGSDRTPVYAYPGSSPGNSVQSPASFYNWFHGTPQTQAVAFSLNLVQNTNGMYTYTNNSFFPLDNIGWKDHCPDASNKQHNYGFCFETHTRFGYSGGEVLTISGANDIWVYINDKLVADLGGIHATQSATIKLDNLNIGMTKSSPTQSFSYKLDIFFCQRHTVASTFSISTNITSYCAYYDWCGICEGSGQSCCTQQMLDTYCNDNNKCTTERCGVQVPPQSNGCVHEQVKCTSSDLCNTATCNPTTGACMTNPVNCDDNNACTDDVCNPKLGCQHTAKSCNDNNACTTDSCSAATGCKNTPIVCNDNNACTTDACSTTSGCTYAPIVCNDNSACTTDACNTSSGCKYTPISCNDNNACTTDACSNSSGCLYAPIVCNDNNACTTDSCIASSGCKYAPIACNDGDDCTTDTCNTTSGCTFTKISGSSGCP